MGQGVLFVRYEQSMKTVWDNFVKESRNGTFMLCRDYVEYHADRFTDHSLLCFIHDRLTAIIPGCSKDDTYNSHAGLTYGGLILSPKCTGAQTLLIMQALIQELRLQGFRTFNYKCIPHIYHRQPCEDDLYALTRCGAQLVRRDLSTAINLTSPLPMARIRQSALKRASRNDIKVTQSSDVTAYWQVVKQNLLARHGVAPVHSADEMNRLLALFPDTIECWEGRNNNVVVAGVILYKNPSCLHVQYSNASEEGRTLGALDAIIAHLIENATPSARYFDFGISTEHNGTVLNESLLYQKESFGGRTVVYDHYELNI